MLPEIDEEAGPGRREEEEEEEVVAEERRDREATEETGTASDLDLHISILLLLPQSNLIQSSPTPNSISAPLSCCCFFFLIAPTTPLHYFLHLLCNSTVNWILCLIYFMILKYIISSVIIIL